MTPLIVVQVVPRSEAYTFTPVSYVVMFYDCPTGGLFERYRTANAKSLTWIMREVKKALEKGHKVTIVPKVE